MLIALIGCFSSGADAQNDQSVQIDAPDVQYASSGDVLLLKEEIVTQTRPEPATTERFETKVGLAGIRVVIPEGTKLVPMGYERLCTSVPVLPGAFGSPPNPICLFDNDGDGLLDRYRAVFQNEVQPQVYRLRTQLKYDRSPQIELSYFRREARLEGVGETEAVIIYREHASRVGPPDFEVALRFKTPERYPELWDVQSALLELVAIDEGLSFKVLKDWDAGIDLTATATASVQRPSIREDGPFGFVWGSENLPVSVGSAPDEGQLPEDTSKFEVEKPMSSMPQLCARALWRPAVDAPVSYGLSYSDRALRFPGIAENAAQADIFMGGDISVRIVSNNILGADVKMCAVFLDKRLFMIHMYNNDLDRAQLTQLFVALDRAYPQNSGNCGQTSDCSARWWRDDDKRVFIEALNNNVQYTYAPLKREFLVRWAQYYGTFIAQTGDELDLGR